MLMFSSRSDFKILSEFLLILDFINHIHYCIRLDLKKKYCEFLILTHFLFFSYLEIRMINDAVKHFGYKIHKTHLK